MNTYTLDTFNPFQNTNPLGGDMERVHYNRQRAQHLSATFLYDLDPESRDLVDSQPGVRVYARPAMQAPDNLYIIGRELARVVDTSYANMPLDLVNRAIDGLEDDGRKAAYREQLAGIGLDGQDTADSYYGLYAQILRDSVRGAYNEQVARMEERREALTGLFGDIVADAQPFSVSNENWRAFHDGVGRGVFTAEDEASLNKAVDAWGMMMGMSREYTDAAANVLADATSGGLIMDRLRGDELAEALFFNQLQRYVQDQRTAEAERNFFVRFAHAFEAADKTLMTGILGGHFTTYVPDEQVAEFNQWRETQSRRGFIGQVLNNLGENPHRMGQLAIIARASGQLNADGSMRTMTDEERLSTQALNAFRGKLFNAAQGMYDIDGVAATFGKMLPSSALYLVPGGVFASAGSMYTQDFAAQLGDGRDWESARQRAGINAVIQSSVEKIAFGSLNPGRMVPGMNWLMSRPLMARALGGLYGTTAGRIGMGAVVGAAEETFAEPLAGLVLSGAYNAMARDEFDLDDPVEEWKKEMEEMLSPDQLLATSLYGLLLGGVSYSGQRAAAAEYRDLREQLVKIGVDEGRAAQVARMENPQERMVAAQALIQERLKSDAGSVLSYVAELYPQMQGLATFENYFDKGQLPRLIPAGDGQVRVQEREADGTVTETVVAESTGRALVEARLEQLSGMEQMEFADMVLANAMVGSLSKDGERWVVSPEGQKMNHEYFQRLARAAGLRLSEGARPEDVAPEVHPHIPLGQLAQQGKAWEARMKVARHDYEQKKGKPVSDEEWARVSKRFESRVNRTGVRGADKRLRTVLRVARGKFGAMEVLEDVTEDNLVRDMEANGRSLDYYIHNLRELEGALGKPGAFLRDLKDGETEGDRRMAVIEAMGKLVQSKVLADTASKGNGLSAALNAFLEMIRSWVLQAKAMFKMGQLVNKVLTDKEAAEKLDKEFREDVDRLVAQDVEFLQELQLADGLEAMQRVEAARSEAAADRRVKRRRRTKTPVLDAAEEKHGEDVRKEQAEKEKTQAEVQADVEAAEAAVDGDFTSSVINQQMLVDSLRANPDLQSFMDCVASVESAKDRTAFDGQEHFFGALSDAAVNELAKDLPENINLQGALHTLTSEDVWHMYRGHCLDSFIYDNQISITYDDIRMIPDIVRNYDSVKVEKESGKWSIVFLKQYGNLTYKYVTHISRKHDSTKTRHIRLKTGWLIKGTGAEDDFTSRQSQAQTASHFPRTAMITQLEESIKQNYAQEARKIAQDAKKHGRTLHAANGKITNLTPVQWLAVRLPSFKNWFGDWENDPANASKVVDENGEPKVYYHHTNALFTEFLHDKKGKTDAGWLGSGFYFYGIEDEGKGYGKNVMECFLNVREPYYASDDDMFRLSEADSIEESEAFTESLIEDGYDGVYYDGDLRQEMMVFEPDQIKSATDNRGTFDGLNADITFSVIGPKAKTWDKYKHRAFTGRDDGKERVEIDASQAKLNVDTFASAGQQAFRRILQAAFWEEMPEEDRKPIMAYAKAVHDFRAAELRMITEAGGENDAEIVQTAKEAKGRKEETLKAGLEALYRVFEREGVNIRGKLTRDELNFIVEDFVTQADRESDTVAEILELVEPNATVPLGALLEYPELYEAYPELARVPVRRESLDGGVLGYVTGALYDGIAVRRGLERDVFKLRSTLLHEIQHLIQSIEGYAIGGNGDFARERYNKLTISYFRERDLRKTVATLRWLNGAEEAKAKLDEFRVAMNVGADNATLEMLRGDYNYVVLDLNDGYSVDTLDYKKSVYADEFMLPSLEGVEAMDLAKVDKEWSWMKSRKRAFPGLEKKMKAKLKLLNDEVDADAKLAKQLEGKSDFELYQRLAGEIEARNVQERRNWTEAERMARPFNDTLEYPGEALVSFSVIGPKAETFDQYADRMFRGRDDGLLRAEIDASKAELKMKLKPEAERTSNVRALHDKLRVYANGLAEYDKFKPVQRLWLLLQSRLTKGMRLSESEDWQRLKGSVCGDVEPGEYLGQLGLSEESSIDDIKAAYLKAESDLHETLSEFVAEENVSEDVFDAAFKVLLGGGNMALTPDDWEGKGETLGDILDYEELYAAYPEMRDIRMEYRSGGSFVRTSDTVLADAKIILGVNKTPEKLRGSLLHEIQHLIQLHEDFAFGGTPSNVGRIFGRLGRDAELTDRGDYDYRRLSGEIEARAVSRRQYMSEAERAGLPFNEAMEYPGKALTYRPSEFYATFDTTFSVSPTLGEDIARARKRAKNADGTISQDGEMSRNAEVELCTMPDFMRFLGEPDVPVVARVFTLRKLLTDHKLTDALTYEVVQKMNDPVLAIQETPSKLLLLLDMESENKIGNITPVVAIIEHKQDKEGNRYLVSAYPLEDDKETKVTNQFNKLVYCKYSTTAKFTANAPQGRAYDLLRAAISGGHTQNVPCQEDVVKWKQQKSDFTASMERASMRALDVLRGRADERAGETLIKDWQRACEAWGQLAGTGEGYLGKGAKTLGEMQALIGATKGVLPEKYCRMGHLNGLMRWAGIYARMQQNGELPRAGVINGPIYQKFVERLQKCDELNRVQGMSEEEAKEALASLAGERLEVAMLKVANECRRRLELFLKDREKERIDWIVERAYPKRQRGQQWPRGKMAAEAYRRMERAYELMKMQPDDLAELIKETKRKLSDLDSSDEKFEAKEEALEDELFLAQTFGAWDNMSFEQARRASGAMAEMVLAGRNEWQEKLRGERRRADYDRRRIAGNFKTSRRDSVKKRAKDAAKEKANRLTIGQAIARGGMSYAQLMLALEPKLGKEFTGRQIRMIAKAHEEIQLFNQERSRWMYKTLAAITGLKKEGEIEEWINANNEIFDTGIVLTPKMVRKCRLTPEEAREWLAMTAEERAERRAKMLAEAEARMEEPDNIPEESQMDELRRKLAASEENGTMPREYELRLETKVEQPLHCTKEALLFAILTFEQDDYKRLMEVNGVTEAQLKRMRELVGPKLLAWGYAMRDKLSEHGERMAELYEAYTGVPFAKRANYFRGVFDNALAKDNGEAIDVQNAITGGKYGIIIPRQYHNQKINWSTSATQVGLSTLNQQQNYISTAHITREWRALLSNQEFEKRMRAEIGDAAMNMIHGWTKLIDGSVMVDAKVQASFKRFFGRLLSAYAVGRLAGNVYTVMKQGSALLNGLVGGRMPERVLENNAVVQQMTYRHIGVGEYLGYLAKAMSGRTEIRWSEIEAAGYIAGRKQEPGHHLEQAAMLAPGQKVPSKLGRKGRAVYEGNMEIIAWADRKSNTVAALAVAEAVYQQAKAENKDGMVPDAELRRVAIQTAGLMIELAAQPQLRTQKNYWAASGALGALGDFFFMFKSEALAKMGVYIAQMFAGNHKAWLAGWLSFGVANSLVLALIDYIRGYWPDDDDEDKWQKRGLSFGTNVLFLDITSVPLLGDFAAWAQAEILGEKPWRSSIADMVMPFGDIWNAGKREVKNIRKAKGWDEHVAAMCSLARALGTSGGWVQNGRSVPVGTCAELALAAAAISNVVRFGKDVVKFLTED